jgi:hypothetical protein
MCLDYVKQEALIVETESYLEERFLRYLSDEPEHTRVGAMVGITLSELRLTNDYRATRVDSKSQEENQATVTKHGVFMSAIELLEAYSYYTEIYAQQYWAWVFRHSIPWLAMAIILKDLSSGSTIKTQVRETTLDTRAQEQIDAIFGRYSPVGEERPPDTPMWSLLLQLRARAQLQLGQTQPGDDSGSGMPMPPENWASGFEDNLMIDAGAVEDFFRFGNSSSAGRSGEVERIIPF